MCRKLTKKLSVMNILVLFLVLLMPFLYIKQTQAAAFAQASIRLDRMTASTATGGMVCVDPTTTASVEASVQVTFPTGFTVGSVAADWDVNTSNLPSWATAWPGIGAEATGVSGQVVTFSSTDLSNASAIYCFNFVSTSTLTNHATPDNDYTGTITTRDSGPTTIDTSNYAVYIVSSGQDQITVTATVPPIFTFSLSGTTDVLGDLSNSSVVSSPTARTVTITTNAVSGWVAWVKSANAALNSASTGANISTYGSLDNTASSISVASGNTGYVLDVDETTDASGGCTLQQPSGYGAEYNGATTEEGGTLSTAFQPIAECAGGTANGDIITLNNRVRISSVQAAATDYTDTLTVVAAGRF